MTRNLPESAAAYLKSTVDRYQQNADLAAIVAIARTARASVVAMSVSSELADEYNFG